MVVVGVVVVGVFVTPGTIAAAVGALILPLVHCFPLLEMVGDVLLPLIPRTQSIAAKATRPATCRGLGRLLPPRLRDVEERGAVEVFDVLA